MAPRFALVTSSLAAREELGPCSIDSRYVLDGAGEVTIDVFVDHDTEALGSLREHGVFVHVSDKRRTELPGEGQVWADVAQARLLAHRHRSEPYDAVLYSAERPGDLALHEPALRDVPRGLVVADGPTAYQRLILDDPGLAASHARELWARSGYLVAADLVVSNVPLGAHGYFDDGMPARFGTWPVPEPTAYDGGPPELLVVVATDEDRRGYSTLLRQVAERIEIDDGTTIAVVHRELDRAAGLVRDLIRNGCPAPLRASTILVPAGRDEVAHRALERADVICAARQVDLAIGAVADRCRTTPTIVLATPRTWTDAEDLRTFGAGDVGADGASDEVAVLPVGGPPGDFVELVDELEAAGKVDAVVLHHPEHAVEALALAELPVAARADVTLVSAPRVPYGDGDPEEPCVHVLAVNRRSWPSLRRLLARAASLEELILRGFDVSAMDTITLAVVPCADHACAGNLEVAPWSDAWTEGGGILARPRVVEVRPRERPPATSQAVAASGEGSPESAGTDLRGWVKGTRWKERAKLALPWRTSTLQQAVAPDSDLPVAVKHWVKDHRWRDRARLALPWKWGLLPKAMEGRW